MSRTHYKRFLRCDFGVNVVYKEENGTRTRRSILFPTTLLDTEEIAHKGLYSILIMKPTPSHVFSSEGHKTEFGVDPCDKIVDFESFISQYHTAHEMERIKLEVIPQMKYMRPSEIITPILEFCTPNGRILYEVSISNITFIDTMSDVCEAANFGFNSFRQTGNLSSLCLKASRYCSNCVDDTPVSLTIAAGTTPDFQINGLHAYASLKESTNKSTDPFVMVTGLIVILLIICVLLCVHTQ